MSSEPGLLLFLSSSPQLDLALGSPAQQATEDLGKDLVRDKNYKGADKNDPAGRGLVRLYTILMY